MRSKWMLLFTVLIVASMLLAPSAPAFAQDEQPPKPPVPTPEEQLYIDPDPELLAQGLVNHGDLWANEGGFIPAEEDEIEAQASLSKPDKYGYRYQNIAVDWIDAYSEGTPIDGEQFDYGDNYVYRELPFPFKFYGYTYYELQISQYGYLNIGGNEWQTVDQSLIGNPIRPNNIIAPNWQPIEPEYDYGGVYTLSGGEAPNRWYTVEWHDFLDTYYYAGYFTFEVVLFENGEILFQYDEMDYPSSYWCSSAGIEDRDGLIYLSTIKFCNQQTSYSAIKIIPPAPTARLAFRPSVSGKLGAPGQVIEHYFNIYNQGDLGEDVFDLSYKGKWPATLNGYDYGLDEWVPLTDTDGDKKIDTGTVAPSDSFEILARITIPASAKIGSRYDSSVTAASSINKKKTSVIALENAVAASFAQTYTDSDGPVIQLSDQNTVQRLRPVTWGDYPGIVETSGGRLMHFLEVGECLDEECWDWRYDIKLSIFEHDGTLVRSEISLRELTGAYQIEVSTYAFAAGPYGTVGITYTNQVDGVLNVHFITVDEDGNLVSGPFNVTQNTEPQYDPETEEPTGPRYVNPQIALTPKDTFTVVWRTLRYDPDTSDVFYAVVDNAGGYYTEPLKLTNAIENISYFTNGTVQTIAGNKTMLAWTYWQRSGKPGKYKYTYYVQYQVTDSYGKVLTKASTIKAGELASGLDFAQTTTGEIVLTWNGSSKGKQFVYYAVISGKTLKKTKGPIQLKYSGNSMRPTGKSITTDWSGNAIITWRDYNNEDLYYALLGKGGAIKTKPMVYQPISEYSNWSGIGSNSSTTYGLRRPVNVTLTVTVPKTTDATGKGVFLAGNFNDWDPAGTPMTRVDKTHWRVTIAGLTEGYPMLYMYTLGTWDDVEKGKKCVEIDDRVLDLAYGTTGAMKKSDTVANWRSVLPCIGD